MNVDTNRARQSAGGRSPSPMPAEGPVGMPGKFTHGSTMRHVLVMTATGSIGLMAIFVVDFLNLFYISLLGQQELTAAIGYAGTLFFFIISIAIGFAIGISALVARALGARDPARGKRLASSGLVIVAAAMTGLAVLGAVSLTSLLSWLGADGGTGAITRRFVLMTLPSAPFLGMGIALASMLRALGDARRAMWVTLGGGIATAILDPLLIFGLHLGIDGAAISTVLARLVLLVIGLNSVARVHRFLSLPGLACLIEDGLTLSAIALPAIMTNIASPAANGYLTAALSAYGEPAIAAWAVIGRLSPLAFAGVFALSSAVGPIIGQNLGAGRSDRVRMALNNSLLLTFIYVMTVWAALFLAQDLIIGYFAATAEAAELIGFYCQIVAGTFLFMGGLFVANAVFNTTGAALLATMFNWGRATVGTIPFAIIGGKLAGAKGVMLGQGLGGVVFGIAAVATAYLVIGRKGNATPP